jgi:hypothetical protein
MLRRSNGAIPMFPKWDAVVLAATLLGGSVVIESSHRVDTGAPDDVIGAAASACDYQLSGMRHGTDVTNDEGFAASDATATDETTPNSCE